MLGWKAMMYSSSRYVPKNDGAICPICEKHFYPTSEWVYNVNLLVRTKNKRNAFYKRPVCSWKCLRTHELASTKKGN